MTKVRLENSPEIKLQIQNLDNFVIKNAILNSVKENLKNFNGNLLDVGCGRMPYKDFILNNSNVKLYQGLDLEGGKSYSDSVNPDFYWNGKNIPFPDNSFETVLLTEVLEHCPEPEIVLREIFRILKKGGILFFTVPFIWNLHEVPYDEYRYTPFSLERHLNNSGFSKLDIQATGGWHASMALMLGTWVRRSSMGQKKRLILSHLIRPIMKKLLVLDKSQPIKFTEFQMITGLYGTARK